MCLQVCGVDHYGLLFIMFGREAGHHPSENALSAPTPPTRLVVPIGGGCTTPAQAISDDEDNPTKNTFVINAWLAVGLRKIGCETCYLRVGQLEKVARITAPVSGR